MRNKGGRNLSLVRAIIVFALLLIVAPSAFSLMASPASKTFTFNPGATVRYELTIINDENRLLELNITPTGELQDRIDVPSYLAVPAGERRSVTVFVRMPQTINPGITQGGILIETTSSTTATVGASSAVMHIVRLRAPQEGPYLSADITSSAGIVGSEVIVTLSLDNIGTVPVSTSPTINLDGKKYDLDLVTLAPNELSDLKISWYPRAVGVYTASAVAPYEDKETRVSKPIVVGELNVKITSIEFGEFRLGDPFRVTIGALNEWGENLPVQAVVSFEQNGRAISSASIPTRAFAPLNEERLTFFLESTGATIGEANITAKLFYADKTTERTEQIIIGIDSIEVMAPSEKESSGALVWILVVLLIGIAAAVGFIYVKNRPEKEVEKNDEENNQEKQ